MTAGRRLALAARLARRELRAGVAGFRIVIACLALGVAAIAGVGSLSAAVRAGLAAESRTLLGGDLDLRLVQRPADDAQAAYLEAAGRLSRVVEMRAMARPEGGAGSRSLVELKAVDGAYPLLGRIELAGAPDLATALERRDGIAGAVADANLLGRLGIGVGGRVRVGAAVFEVRATIVREPDRVASLVNFGPRLMVPLAALDETGLVQPGSQIRWHYRLLLPAGASPAEWKAATEERFPLAGWRIRLVDEAAPGVARFIERMTLFLTFAGLAALLIGGIGVTNAVKAYMEARAATVATLKCLGAESGTVFAAYLMQVMALASLGVAIGLAVGAALPWLADALLAGRLPVALHTGIFAGPLALAALFGLLAAAVFAFWPLARARRIPGGALFRDDVAPRAGRPAGTDVALAGLGALLLAGLTFAAVSDRWFAAWFVGGTLLVLSLLRLAAWALARLAARLPTRRPGLRLALANLHRPGAATPSVLLSLGLGMAVLVAVAQIEGNMVRQIAERLPDEAPAFFFVDIQSDQAAAFDQVARAVPGVSEVQRVPTVRGRIVRIAGRPVEEADVAPDAQWAIRGDRALTFAARPSEGSEIVAGQWWPETYAGEPLISLDAGLARGFHIGLGDSLTFNVLGREISGRITSLREIDWRTLRFDFAVIFSPGVLEAAPLGHIAAAKVARTGEEALERAVTERFPNVSAIRVREALEAVNALMAGIGEAVRGTAALTVLAGGLVLAGAVAAGRARRVRDAVVFKVLGATRSTVLRAFLLEYGLLGLAAGGIGTALGTLVGWAVMRFLMRSEWVFLPGIALRTVIACLVLALMIGFIGTWRALGVKSAPLLRNE